jgi:hypothetical protein
MKKIEVSQEFYDSAVRIANYVCESECESESYVEFLEEGGIAENHIFHHASVICAEEEKD